MAGPRWGTFACIALFDTGSNAALVLPNIIPARTAVQATDVQLKTVTGDLAPITGRGVLVFQFEVGGLTVAFAAWVADIQDACILWLDFLRVISCVLDLDKGCLLLPEGRRL